MATKKEIIRLKHNQHIANYLKLLNQSSDRNQRSEKFEDLQTTSLSSLFDITESANETQTTEGPEFHIHPHVISGLGLLILFISVAIIIAIIAAVINKMRKQKTKKENDDMDTERSRSNSIDPYLQAIVFPSEPTSEWKRYVSKTLRKASQKLTGKEDVHRMTIPEHLRHQLKHIYVY